MLWYAVGLTLLTALICGMAPALQASKPDVQDALKRDGIDRGIRGAGWVRGGLIAVQVTVCLVLLISAGLLLRALCCQHARCRPGLQERRQREAQAAATVI